jgi:hypothetical protein
VFRENRRSASSQAVAGVYLTVRLKFILRVGPKVKETWLGSVHDGLRVRVKGMITV